MTILRHIRARSTPTTTVGWLHQTRSWRMPLVACAALTIAGCGTSASEQKLAHLEASAQIYSTTPAAAHTALANLRAAPGFERTGSCPRPTAGTYSACFTRKRGLVLTGTKFRDLILTSGLTPTRGTLECTRFRHSTVPRLQFIGCRSIATLGPVRFAVTANSLVEERAQAVVTTTRTVRGVDSGAHFTVTDVGTLNGR